MVVNMQAQKTLVAMKAHMTELMNQFCDDEWPDVEFDNAVETCEAFGIEDEEFQNYFCDNWSNIEE